MSIKSEAKLTTFEAISMIVGNSIGTGIIAVPYLATKNSMIDVIWMVGAAYIINVILHLIIAELSYNNGGVQLVKSFEGELFRGVMKKVFSWIVFVVYGLAYMINRNIGFLVMVIILLAVEIFIEKSAMISEKFHPLIGLWHRIQRKSRPHTRTGNEENRHDDPRGYPVLRRPPG